MPRKQECTFHEFCSQERNSPVSTLSTEQLPNKTAPVTDSRSVGILRCGAADTKIDLPIQLESSPLLSHKPEYSLGLRFSSADVWSTRPDYYFFFHNIRSGCMHCNILAFFHTRILGTSCEYQFHLRFVIGTNNIQNEIEMRIPVYACMNKFPIHETFLSGE